MNLREWSELDLIKPDGRIARTTHRLGVLLGMLAGWALVALPVVALGVLAWWLLR